MQEILKEIRLALFARRNGVVADALKASGDPHELIMGCPLSDIIDVAKGLEPSTELAEALWADRKHRECRLIATMLYPTAQCDLPTALRWCRDVMNVEEADVLCHRLLRHLECSPTVMRQLLAEEAPLLRYTAFRLMLNLTASGRMAMTDELRQVVSHEAAHGYSASMATLLKNLLED